MLCSDVVALIFDASEDFSGSQTIHLTGSDPFACPELVPQAIQVRAAITLVDTCSH